MAADHKYQLRIAILCRGHRFQAWEADCIRQVLQLPFAKAVLLVAEEESSRPKSFAGKAASYPFRRLLWRLHNRFFPGTAIFDEVNLEPELKEVPLIRCRPETKGKFSQYFSESDIRQIRAAQPDLILRFGFNILRGEILTVAPYGVWSYHHADEQRIRGGPAAFWEIYHGHPVTGAILQRLTEKLDAGIVLRKGWFGTVRHSYKANLEQLVHGSSAWMKQVCIDIHNNRAAYFNDKPVNTQAPVYKLPVNWQMILFWFKLLGKKIRFHWNDLFLAEFWQAGIARQPLESLLTGQAPAQVEWIPQEKKHIYHADPFGFTRDGKETVLFEKYDYRTGKGAIARLENGKESIVLAGAHHLSYPFVLQQDGDILVIPEAWESGASTVFNWKNDGLVPARQLLDFPAVDVNVIFYRGKWWLFCTHAGDGPNHHLYVYHAEKAEGPWTAHANNPVKCDVRSARPAGAPFIREGRLFRPAQDCSVHYGRAVVIHEVLELTPDSFREAAVQRLRPNENWPFHDGMHHIAPLGEEACLLDAKKMKFDSAHFRRTLKRKLGMK